MMIINGVYGSEPQKPKEIIHSTSSKEVEVEIDKSNSASVSSSFNVNEANLLTYEDSSKKTTETDKNQVEIPKEEKWDDTMNRMSSEDCEELSKEDTDLKALDIDELEKALTRIKEERVVQKESVEDQKVKLESKEEAIKSIAKYSRVSKEIYDKLEKYNLPITEENIARMASVLEMSMVIPGIDSGSMQYLIKNNLEPTVKNIYKAIYSGNGKGFNQISEETYKTLENSANQVIDNSLLENKEEAKDIAKWLLGNHLPLTEESLWAYKDIVGLKENYKEDDILDKIIIGFSKGESPEDVYLGKAYEERVNNVCDSISKIEEQGIKQTLINTQENKTINCSNLVQGQIEANSKDINNALEKTNDTESIDIKAITILRQLEEIRLKMTVEAGTKLIKQGIKIETADLSKLVDGLREIENNYYKNLLSERKVDTSEVNIELLKTNIEKLDALKGMPSYILGSTYKLQESRTIDTLNSEGNALRAELAKANEAYETLMTTPRKDLGDSIQKAFRNVDDILKDMNLELTKDNQRAVRILGYNSMEITHENINNIKAYDSDVNYMMKNLHPSVTVELIRKGINPSDIPINELNQQIDEINDEIGVSKEEKYSKYLWKLEKAGITKEEKESYIGIYRLLNNVEKTNGAALGAVVKADQEMTLNNLLSAVRTMKSGGIEANIDDDFGLLSEVSYKNDKITDQIKSGFMEKNNPSEEKLVSYMDNLVKEIKNEISPSNLNDLGNTDKILNTPLDVLYDELLELPYTDELDMKYFEERKSEYEDILKDSKEAMSLLKDLNLPNNLYNVQGAKEYLSLDNTFFHQYQKNIGKEDAHNIENEEEDNSLVNISDNIIDSFTDKSSVNKVYENISNKINEKLESTLDTSDISAKDILDMQKLNNSILFISNLAQSEKYQVPIAIGDNITNVNVTLVHNTLESGKVDINLTSEVLGQVTIQFTLKDNKLNGIINLDNRTGQDIMNDALPSIKDKLEQNDIIVSQLNVTLNTKGLKGNYINSSSIKNNNAEEVSNEDKVNTNKLYEVARNLLVQIKTIESTEIN